MIKRTIKSVLKLLPDKAYIQLRFFYRMGRIPNLKNPKTYNEKLQWLKLNDRKPEYTTMVDKYEAKKYVAERIGEEYIIPTLGVWEKFEDIDFDSLPNQFVLKCTHDSGGLVICRDKSKLDMEDARKKITASLKTNYYYDGREWPYKNVKPRIIVEQYMEDTATAELRDYKYYCFHGVAKMVMIVSERATGETKADYYDMNFEHLDLVWGYPHSNKQIDKPKNFEKMRILSDQLAEGIPFLRVDFYEINGSVYFGELTFFDGGGTQRMEPIEWDYKLGSWLSL